MRRLVALILVAACGGDDGGAGGDGGADSGVGGGGSTAAHMTCEIETNKYRAMKGKPALAHSQPLEDYAQDGAEHDFTTSPHDHFSQTQGGGIAFAENECPHQLGWRVPSGGSVEAVVAMCIKAFFDEGPGGGHYENMMGAYKTIGCGIHRSGDSITIVQDLGM
jgi:hypothetical protein